ncbi:hypothetical protein L6R52_09575 [Myxococcota bacterium]|nr:hypothetical protein [Myxococcota bacterium]
MVHVWRARLAALSFAVIAAACGAERDRGSGARPSPRADAGARDAADGDAAQDDRDGGVTEVDATIADGGARVDAGASDGGVGARASIVYRVKQGLEAEGAAATARELVVTAVASTGFFAQVAEGSAEYDATLGPLYGGIFVYLGRNVAAPALGDVVDVSGASVARYFSQWQLTGGRWTRTRSGAVSAVTASMSELLANGASSPYEGLLVTVTDVSVSDAAPAPGTGDVAPTNEVELAGGLRVDDFAGHVLSPFPSAGTTFDALTGVLGWRNGQLKLYPRSGADVVRGAAPVDYFIDFEDLSHGTFVTTQYPDVVIAGEPGYAVMVYSEPLFASSGSNFLCVVRAGQPSSTCEPNGGLTITFSRPAERVTLTVLGANGTNVGRYELYSGAALVHAEPLVISVSQYVPTVLDLGAWGPITRIELVEIDDAYGLSWDDLAFSLR